MLPNFYDYFQNISLNDCIKIGNFKNKLMSEKHNDGCNFKLYILDKIHEFIMNGLKHKDKHKTIQDYYKSISNIIFNYNLYGNGDVKIKKYLEYHAPNIEYDLKCKKNIVPHESIKKRTNKIELCSDLYNHTLLVLCELELIFMKLDNDSDLFVYPKPKGKTKSEEMKNELRWIVILHDVCKNHEGGDNAHPYRCAKHLLTFLKDLKIIKNPKEMYSESMFNNFTKIDLNYAKSKYKYKFPKHGLLPIKDGKYDYMQNCNYINTFVREIRRIRQDFNACDRLILTIALHKTLSFPMLWLVPYPCAWFVLSNKNNLSQRKDNWKPSKNRCYITTQINHKERKHEPWHLQAAGFQCYEKDLHWDYTKFVESYTCKYMDPLIYDLLCVMSTADTRSYMSSTKIDYQNNVQDMFVQLSIAKSLSYNEYKTTNKLQLPKYTYRDFNKDNTESIWYSNSKHKITGKQL